MSIVASGSRQLVTIKTDETTLATIEGIVGECSLEALSQQNQFFRTLKLAAGISALRRVITDEMMREVMPLQGSSLGFRTDKDTSGGYPVAAVKDCMIEAVLKGAYMVGNEVNIISGRAYFTKEFYTRKLREYPGLTDLKIKLGVPVLREGKAYVAASADWRLGGHPGRLEKAVSKIGDRDVDERIPVKVNAGMSDDAILGKAERKMRKAIYDMLTGSETSDGDISDSAAPRQPAATLEALATKLEGKEPEVTQTETEALPADLLAFKSVCENATLYGDITKAEESLCGEHGRELTEDESALVEAWKTAGAERIKNSRGDRSNRQKTLT